MVYQADSYKFFDGAEAWKNMFPVIKRRCSVRLSSCSAATRSVSNNRRQDVAAHPTVLLICSDQGSVALHGDNGAEYC
jgi:hypothetical protein